MPSCNACSRRVSIFDINCSACGERLSRESLDEQLARHGRVQEEEAPLAESWKVQLGPTLGEQLSRTVGSVLGFAVGTAAEVVTDLARDAAAGTDFERGEGLRQRRRIERGIRDGLR